VTDKPNPPIQPDPNNPSPFPEPPQPTPATVIKVPLPAGMIDLLDPTVIAREVAEGDAENAAQEAGE
jgi:hypothetical protein